MPEQRSLVHFGNLESKMNLLLGSAGKKIEGLIYILLWTSPFRIPFHRLDLDRYGHKTDKCHYNNCRVFTDLKVFTEATMFDVIIFNVVDLQSRKPPLHATYHESVTEMPFERTKEQLYIFFSVEPPCLNPLFYNFEGYFNLTWTYKFDSNLTFPYIRAKNKFGEIVTPNNKHVHWKDPSEMLNATNDIKEKLKNKATAVAWFVSNCNANSKRGTFVENLKKELEKYGHTVDVYGQCGSKKCPKLASQSRSECDQMLEKNYYFYLAYENSISEDYVSEKVLHGLHHYTVPVVFGGANYERFLPPGSYLDARQLGAAKLAQKINESIADKEKYYEYFKWLNHYEYDDNGVFNVSMITDQFCELCALLNKLNRKNETYTFNNIVNWWNEPNNSDCRYPYTWNETVSRWLGL